MDNKKYLVIGATGHVGSKITILLADRGYDVTAMVRQKNSIIKDPHKGLIKYVVGDLSDEDSIKKAVKGIDVVINTANGLLPQKKGDSVTGVNEGAVKLISICEEGGISRFVQSSTPTFKRDNDVPELLGKRMIEKRLATSSMQSIIIRNPAFMDVFIVMGGFAQASDKSLHATTKREYGFAQMYMKIVGDFVVKRGWMLAPGGADHGTPTISTRDVAEMLVGGAVYEGSENLLIEAGGPQWLTWREIAAIIAQKTGRKKIRLIPIPAWLAQLNRAMVKPFSDSAANMFAMMGFVAAFQPKWDSVETVKKLKLPKQLTVSDYLDINYKK